MIEIKIVDISKTKYDFNEGFVKMVIGNTIMEGLGCSKAELDRWVPVDAYVKNPHYSSAHPMKLYNPSIMAISDESIKLWRENDLKNGVVKRLGKGKPRQQNYIKIGEIALHGVINVWMANVEITFHDNKFSGTIFVKTAQNEKSACKKIVNSIEKSYLKFATKHAKNDKNIIAAFRRALKKICSYDDFFECMVNGPKNYNTLDKNDTKRVIDNLYYARNKENAAKKLADEQIKKQKQIEENNRKEQEFILIQNAIKNTPEYVNYPSLFPIARGMKREFIFHAGPTNSGKTHGAIQELMQAETGMYLAPLRLMAMEAHDRMNAAGILTDMSTGEERFKYDGAKHIASTIEMMDVSKPVDVCVIDEVQMITDEDRGWAWTQAIVGCPAKKIIMTGSPEVGTYLKKLIMSLNDTYEEIQFTRLNSLNVIKKMVGLYGLKPGDAIIAFSRRRVLELHDMLNHAGISVACIYGALSPEVRRRESERFSSGEVDVLVATDAIGMGLNLPIKRVLFSSLKKYDGYGLRELHGKEIRQIAGRAGRYNIDPEKNINGEAGVFYDISDRYPVEKDDIDTIRYQLNPDVFTNAFSYQYKTPSYPVVPTIEMIRIISEKYKNNLVQALEISEKLLKPRGENKFNYTFTKNNREMATFINKYSKRPVWNQYEYIGCPVRLKDDICSTYFEYYLKKHKNNESIVGFCVKDVSYEFETSESLSNVSSIYMWLSEKYPENFNEKNKAIHIKRKMDDTIEYHIYKQYKDMRIKMAKEKKRLEEKQKIDEIKRITFIDAYKQGKLTKQIFIDYMETKTDLTNNVVSDYTFEMLNGGILDIDAFETMPNKPKKLYKKLRNIVTILNHANVFFKNQEKLNI